MPKLDYLQQKKLNPADELREILSSLEERLPQMKSFDSDQALQLLLDLDQVDTLFHQLESADLNLLPERGRFQSLLARLRKRAAPLLRSLGGPAALRARRPTPSPPPEKWWWYLDERVAAQRRRLLRQVALIGVVILVLLSGLRVLFQTVLAPSPEIAARLEAENNAYNVIDSGDYRQALAFIEQGLVKAPGNPDLLLLKGVVEEILGEDTSAAASFEQAQTSINDPLSFSLARSQLQLRLGQFSKAEHDARTALELDENSARAWFLLGQALEFQNKLAEAIPAYQHASELGLDSGDSEIVVMARMALGRLAASP
ncbi:MAG: tetratricopeptide repeat protein [Chloroflexi bacterium]|nr:tetratricopeptide repeat protein [Chloroflexota bacterium]